MSGDDRHRLAAAGHGGRRAIWDRHRRNADPAAGRLGRLFRPGELRAIRGLALSAQVLAQAAGPLLSGILRDWTGSYTRSLEFFVALSALSILAAWAARQPRIAPA
jgi:hypothetical protein